MTDWKQITARIRRARTGKDPAGQLSNLFEKTRDAMVAFELARHFETAGQGSEAIKWYSTAAERFRRADWKTKAQEAIAKLSGAPLETPSQSAMSEASEENLSEDRSTTPLISIPEPGLPFEQNAATFEVMVAPEEEKAATSTSSAPAAEDQRQRRRRGRRGGRNRRKDVAGAPARPAAGDRSEPAKQRHTHTVVQAGIEGFPSPSQHVTESLSALRLPLEGASDAGAVRGRSGDPALSSRLSLLEMQFRRLLTCAPARLEEADRAPVGPGVLLLTDSDLTTYYYVEACQTLRIAIANLLRGGASRRDGESIKPRLAEHLGIAESRVAKYLADHCVVRWLQLDEGASHFAHFVIAVVRPSLNE